MSLYLCPREGCGFGVAGDPSPEQWDEPDPIMEHADEHHREDIEAGVPSPVRLVDMAGNVTILAARPATDPTNLAGLTRAPGRHVAEPTFGYTLVENFVKEHGQRRAPGRHVQDGAA